VRGFLVDVNPQDGEDLFNKDPTFHTSFFFARTKKETKNSRTTQSLSAFIRLMPPKLYAE
jgi:hypothetical protein